MFQSCCHVRAQRRSTVPARARLSFAILILTSAWAQASEISFQGGPGCSSGNPIFGHVFTFTANAVGGFCAGFGNDSGMNFDSLKFVTTIPTVNPNFFCSPEPYFLSCGFTMDTTANTLTILFSGLDGTHHGIPVAPPC